MSPQLRGLIAQHMHGEWLRNISFLRNVKHPNDLAAAVALALVHQMYMPGEYIIKHGDECKALYVVDEGRLTRAGGGVMTSLNRRKQSVNHSYCSSAVKPSVHVSGGTTTSGVSGGK
eukprot:gene44596-59509_t